MAFQLAMGCQTSGYRSVHRVCGYGCCPKPVVLIEDLSGSGFDYEVDNADSAFLHITPDGSPTTITPISLADGSATGTYSTGGLTSVLGEVHATNACGTTIRYWRNYTVPRPCDCTNAAYEMPSKWGKAGSIVTTITGSASPVSLVVGGITHCPSPAACGDVTGSFVRPCGSTSQHYLVTSYTGCSDYYYYINFYDLSAFANWPFGGYYNSYFHMESGWFQALSNPYPTLTHLGGTPFTSLVSLIGTYHPIQTRGVSNGRSSFFTFAPISTMLKCYRGTLVGVGGDFTSSDDTSVPVGNTGHCDLSGLIFDAEVID